MFGTWKCEGEDNGHEPTEAIQAWAMPAGDAIGNRAYRECHESISALGQEGSGKEDSVLRQRTTDVSAVTMRLIALGTAGIVGGIVVALLVFAW